MLVGEREDQAVVEALGQIVVNPVVLVHPGKVMLEAVISQPITIRVAAAAVLLLLGHRPALATAGLVEHHQLQDHP